MVAHVWIVVALINAELLKQVVFEAVRPRGAFGLVRASVVRSDCVESNFQSLVRVVCVCPADREVGLVHPDNAVAVSGVLREVGVVDRIPVFTVPGGLLAYNVKIDAELIHGWSEKLVHVEDLRELVLYAVAVGLLGDRGNGFAQLDELLLQRQRYRWGGGRLCGRRFLGCCHVLPPYTSTVKVSGFSMICTPSTSSPVVLSTIWPPTISRRFLNSPHFGFSVFWIISSLPEAFR